ncbi:MAG: hypothetical protein NVS1B13_23360 [Flavisolibacter sp.]
MKKISNRNRFLIGLVAITILYFIYNVFLDITTLTNIPRQVKHINKLACVLLVYGTGSLILRKFTVSWMMQLWHIMHLSVILLLLLIGFYDWWQGMITPETRNIANSLFDFLISPVLYVSMGLLQLTVVKTTAKSKSLAN